ncbi:MAG: phospholipid carrier-dependent glycosyltransferase [Acidobacteriota bacterium]
MNPKHQPAPATKAISPAIGMSTRAALAWLLVIGAITHLTGLTYPRQVVFDEVHWGKFLSDYCCTGQRLFDVHPPHAKLLLALGAKLGGYDGSFPFATIGQPYLEQPLFALRLIPALAGMAVPPLVFLLMQRLGGSQPVAWIGGVLLAFDNALLLESHVLNLDGILVAAILASLVCLLQADRESARPRAVAFILAAGALAGFAAGTKFNGLVAFGMITIYVVVRSAARPAAAGKYLAAWLLAGGAALLVYGGGWAIHFALLPNPGPGDAFYSTTGHFFTDLRTVHRTMWSANLNLAQTHIDASRPWTWPFMKVAPFYWVGPGASIYLVGNPLVWWGSSLLLVVLLTNNVLIRVTRLRVDGVRGRAMLWLPLTAYAMSYLPLFPVSRVLFLYHYLTPLVFGVVYVLLWLDRAGWIRPGRVRDQRVSYYGVIAATVVAFLLVSPLTYGYSAGQYDEWLAAIVRSWR